MRRLSIWQLPGGLERCGRLLATLSYRSIARTKTTLLTSPVSCAAVQISTGWLPSGTSACVRPISALPTSTPARPAQRDALVDLPQALGPPACPYLLPHTSTRMVRRSPLAAPDLVLTANPDHEGRLAPAQIRDGPPALARRRRLRSRVRDDGDLTQAGNCADAHERAWQAALAALREADWQGDGRLPGLAEPAKDVHDWQILAVPHRTTRSVSRPSGYPRLGSNTERRCGAWNGSENGHRPCRCISSTVPSARHLRASIDRGLAGAGAGLERER